MLVQATGPPFVALRPHKRQRRLAMDRVRASELRSSELRERRRREIEEAYERLNQDAIRQADSDRLLDRLGDLVAASLSVEWRPILRIEPAIRVAVEADEYNGKREWK